MSQPDDTRLEHELRDALDRRDPGAAPIALRERLLRVPDEVPAGQPRSGRQALNAVLGLAAVVGLAVVVLSVSGQFGKTPAASFAAPSAPALITSQAPEPTSPNAAATTEPTPFVTPIPSVSIPPGETPYPVATTQLGAGPEFDPSKEGIGILTQADDGNGLRVFIGILVAVLAIVAVSLKRWARIVPALVAAGLTAWVLVASLIPANLQDSGFGPGLYLHRAETPPGFSESVMYELAPAGQHFSFLVTGLGTDSPVAVTVDGVEEPRLDPRRYVGFVFSAVWVDREPGPYSGGPSTPFQPLTLDPQATQSFWIIGRASQCAVGPSWSPAVAASGGQMESRESLVVQINVLGIPRRVELPLGARIVEPRGDSCSVDQATPTSGPGPSGSAAPTSSTP